MVERCAQHSDVDLDAVDDGVVEREPKPIERILAVDAVGDHLG